MRRSLFVAAALFASIAAPAQAGTLSVQGGVLSYTETDVNARNTVTISMSSDGSRITLTDSGRSGGRALSLRSDGSCTASKTAGSCPAAGVGSIAVSVGELDDTVAQNTSITSRLAGGNGNDK